MASGNESVTCPGELGDVGCTRYTHEFQPDGTVITRTADGEGSSTGTWTLDGDTLTIRYSVEEVQTFHITFLNGGTAYTYENNFGEAIYDYTFIRTAVG